MDKAPFLIDTPTDQDADYLSGLNGMVEERLRALLSRDGLRLERAMNACIFNGGKRLRPKLVLLTAQALGVDVEHALHPACALEMIHTASLILDDLPCMDDAAQRRGAPACHITFGEDIAILAAVTLITESFRVINTSLALTAPQKVQICTIVSTALGAQGLAAGQESDLRDMASCDDVGAMEQMEHNKTSALFVACMKIAGILAGANQSAMQALQGFGKHLGLAFQIFDDLLDNLGTTDSTGKDHKQDADRATFATVLSSSDAEAKAKSELHQSLCKLRDGGVEAGRFDLLISVLFQNYQKATNVIC